MRGINLHAVQVVDGRDRRRVERLGTYTTRPPAAQERLERRPDGKLVLTFKKVWRDGSPLRLMIDRISEGELVFGKLPRSARPVGGPQDWKNKSAPLRWPSGAPRSGPSSRHGGVRARITCALGFIAPGHSSTLSAHQLGGLT